VSPAFAEVCEIPITEAEPAVPVLAFTFDRLVIVLPVILLVPALVKMPITCTAVPPAATPLRYEMVFPEMVHAVVVDVETIPPIDPVVEFDKGALTLPIALPEIAYEVAAPCTKIPRNGGLPAPE